jgi:hypothetical protein
VRKNRWSLGPETYLSVRQGLPDGWPEMSSRSPPRINERVMKWLNKRGLLRGDDDSHQERELSPSEDFAEAAMQRGTLVSVASDGDDDDDAEVARSPPSPAVGSGREQTSAATRTLA